MALFPRSAGHDLAPLDQISATAANIDVSAINGAAPEETVELHSQQGAAFSKYEVNFNARLNEIGAGSRLVTLVTNDCDITLFTAPGRTLVLQARRADGETRTLRIMRNAFSDDKPFYCDIYKNSAGIIIISTDGNPEHATAMNPPALELRRVLFNQSKNPVCILYGAGIEYTSYTTAAAAAGKRFSVRFYQALSAALWAVMTLALLTLCAALCRTWPGPQQHTGGANSAQTVSLLVLAGFCAATAFSYIKGSYLCGAYPLNTFLFKPEDFMADLLNTIKFARDYNPYLCHEGFEPPVYLPLVYLPYFVLANIPETCVRWFFFLSVLGIFIAVNTLCLKKTGLIRQTLWTNVLIFSLLTYPLLFCLDRANIEIYIFFVMAGAVFLLLTGRARAAAVTLAVAIAVKGYPAIFLLLFLKRGKWRDALACCALACLFLLGALASFKGGFAENFAGMLTGVDFYVRRYALEANAYGHNNSIFNLMRIVGESSYRMGDRAFIMAMSQVIAAAGGISTLVLAWRARAPWQQVMPLVCATMLFTPVSQGYKLIGFFLPLWLFLTAAQRSRFDNWYAVLFGLLLIPKEYPLPFAQTTIQPMLSAAANPLILILFCLLIASDDTVSEPDS